MRGRSSGRVHAGAGPHRSGRMTHPTCGRAAVKGRWAGMPIDPAAYGSCTGGFALRNLHKSPLHRGLAARRICGVRTDRGRPPTCGDWCRFRAAGLELQPRSTCGYATGAQVPAGRGCTFFEVRCTRVGDTPFRAHFLRFVADPCRAPRARRGFASEKPQVGRVPSTEPTEEEGRSTSERPTNRRKCPVDVQRTSKNVHERAISRRGQTRAAGGVHPTAPAPHPQPPHGGRRPGRPSARNRARPADPPGRAPAERRSIFRGQNPPSL